MRWPSILQVMWYFAGYGTGPRRAFWYSSRGTSVIKFLGIEIDSWAMECHLPDDKLDGLKEEVRLASEKHKIQLREL